MVKHFSFFFPFFLCLFLYNWTSKLYSQWHLFVIHRYRESDHLFLIHATRKSRILKSSWLVFYFLFTMQLLTDEVHEFIFTMQLLTDEVHELSLDYITASTFFMVLRLIPFHLWWVIGWEFSIIHRFFFKFSELLLD